MKLLEAFAQQNVTYACFFISLQHWGYQIIIIGYQRIIIGDVETIINGLHGPGLDFPQPIYRFYAYQKGFSLKKCLYCLGLNRLQTSRSKCAGTMTISNDNKEDLACHFGSP